MDNCYLCLNPNNYIIHTHELFSGSGNRKRSIEYKLQVGLCMECHREATKRNLYYRKIICDKLGFNNHNYNRLVRIFHKATKHWSKADTMFMEFIRKYMESVNEV